MILYFRARTRGCAAELSRPSAAPSKPKLELLLRAHTVGTRRTAFSTASACRDGRPRVLQMARAEVPADARDAGRRRPAAGAVAPDGAECAWTDGHEGEPHSVAVDDLYLDCNGIVHPCCHPEDGPQPRDEKEMFANVAELINRLVRATRPRRLLYLALDGVAPRAKLNQQRARRFCAARERRRARRRRSSGRAAPRGPPAAAPLPEPWDHNVITPGTEFMDHLAQFLRATRPSRPRAVRTHGGGSPSYPDAGTPVRRDSREQAKREGEKGGMEGAL